MLTYPKLRPSVIVTTLTLCCLSQPALCDVASFSRTVAQAPLPQAVLVDTLKTVLSLPLPLSIEGLRASFRVNGFDFNSKEEVEGDAALFRAIPVEGDLFANLSLGTIPADNREWHVDLYVYGQGCFNSEHLKPFQPYRYLPPFTEYAGGPTSPMYRGGHWRLIASDNNGCVTSIFGVVK